MSLTLSPLHQHIYNHLICIRGSLSAEKIVNIAGNIACLLCIAVDRHVLVDEVSIYLSSTRAAVIISHPGHTVRHYLPNPIINLHFAFDYDGSGTAVNAVQALGEHVDWLMGEALGGPRPLRIQGVEW